jgi:hypothetical protein
VSSPSPSPSGTRHSKWGRNRDDGDGR